MNLFTIRTAHRQDADAIAKIQIQAWQTGYHGIMPQHYLDSLSLEAQSLQWQKTLSTNDPGTYLVINYNNTVSGFCVYGPARDHDISICKTGEIVALNIAPRHWGKKLATRLIQQVLNAAVQNQWQVLYLWVIQQNTAAISLYKSLGFEFDGSEKFDNKLTGHTLHEIRFVKNII